MLDICNIGHDEVCYEGAYCPACMLAAKLRAKIDRLEQDIEVLEAINQSINTVTLTRQERENRRELKEFPHK